MFKIIWRFKISTIVGGMLR